MRFRFSRWTTGALALLLLLSGPAGLRAADDEALGFERTPPRLSLVEGEVSFWRSGATDWASARANIPLSEGDELYTGGESSFEIQIGSRAYVRVDQNTQLGLTGLEPDYLQLRLTNGTTSLDLRSLRAGQTLEVDTPNAAFTIERTGYYRVDVTGEATRFSSRRGGYASVTTANGASAAIAPSEQVVVTGLEDPMLETYAAPELDGWDRWNYSRTDQQLDALSSRYVPADVYGLDDLDHYGNWRVVPTYGAVWVPHVARDWAPYSTGSWIYDPYYGWSWVDDAPWGWAPFHHGRWMFIDGYWGWCPGPRVVRVYYAPALVAFFGGPSISIGFGRHHFGWVALGWGEPLVPWWGPSHWRRSPRWAGWGGPRIVNNVVIKRTTVINVNHIEHYANASRRGAFVAVDRGDFGRRRVRDARLKGFDATKLRPVRGGDLALKPDPGSMVGTDRRGKRPHSGDFERAVVATREPRRSGVPDLDRRKEPKRVERSAGHAGSETRLPSARPPTRVVTRAPERRTESAPNRPPVGRRSDEERTAAPRPPRYQDVRKQRVPEPRAQESGGPSAPSPRDHTSDGRPTPRPEHSERQRAEPSEPRPETRRELPGEPANRVFRRSNPDRKPDASPRAGPSDREPSQGRGNPTGRKHERSEPRERVR